MRKNVKVIGIGSRRTGTSKAGNQYDFTPVTLAYPEDGFNGYRAETCNMDTALISGINVNDQLDVVFHFQNYKMVVDAIL